MPDEQQRKLPAPAKNPFVHGWNCGKCGNPTFHVINDGGCVLILSCTKCGHKKDVLICTCGDDD